MLEALSGEEVVGMKWRVLLLVLFARMLFLKRSTPERPVCGPLKLVEMVVVKW